jgi:phage terminase large subunit
MNPILSLHFLKKVCAGQVAREIPHWLVPQDYQDQAKIVLDDEKDVAILGTRRSGKTHSIALRLLRAARKHPKSLALYIALTRDSAKSIMWPVLQEVIEKNKIDATMKEHDLTVHLANSSIIKIVGADMKNFMQRLRGAKYSEVAIDEMQSWRAHVTEMVDEVLKPALIDFNGALVIAGTPGPIKDGYFYEVTEKHLGGYSQHRLFMQKNPFIPNANEWLEKHIKKQDWSMDNPTLRREYFGEWVDDPEALVYKFSRDRNLKPFDNLRVPQPIYVMGLDFGFNDKTAVSVIAYSETTKLAWVVYCEGRSGLDVTDIAFWVKQIRDRYGVITIEADTGGLGKTISAELISRHGIFINPAEKTDKLSWIALLNDELRQGHLFVSTDCPDLADQYMTLTKDDHGKEDPRLQNDLCDSVLYNFRKVYNYLAQPIKPRLDYGSNEWAKEQEQRAKDQAREEAIARHALDDDRWV